MPPRRCSVRGATGSRVPCMETIADIPPEVRRSIEESLSSAKGWTKLSKQARQRRIERELRLLLGSMARAREGQEYVERTAAARRTVVGTSPSVPLWGSHCRERPGPPCWKLLDDPQAVIENRACWPEHVCESTMHESLRHWARSNLKTLTAEQRATLTGYSPLPVGKVSLMKRAALYGDAISHACARSCSYLPFDGEEEAA